MLFGSKETFGFECQPFMREGNIINGHLCMWCKLKQVGRYSNVSDLAIARQFFRSTLKYEGRRTDSSLAGLSDLQVFKLVREKLNSKRLNVGAVDPSERKRFDKLRLAPGGGESFDRYFAILRDEPGCQRLLWRQADSSVLHEGTLQKREYERVTREFLRWLYKTYEMAPEKEALRGDVFFVSGNFRSKSKKEWQAVIESHGGRVVSSTDQYVTHLVIGNDIKPEDTQIKLRSAPDAVCINEAELSQLLEDAKASL